MSDTSDSREVWVLERNGFPALVDEDEFDCVSPHRFKHTCFQNGKRVDTESTRYIPAPTWRPIAEMPKEWRDRRAVLCLLPGGDCGGVDPDPVCLRYEGVNWYDDTVTTRCPVLYLDLAIPEVPRG